MIGQSHFCSRMTVPTPLLKGNYWWWNTEFYLVWHASASSINPSLSSHNWSCTEELFFSVTDERFCRSGTLHMRVNPILFRTPFFEGLGLRKKKRLEGWGVRETKGKPVEVLGVETRNQAITFQLGLVTIVVGIGHSSSSLSLHQECCYRIRNPSRKENKPQKKKKKSLLFKPD